MVFIAHVGWEVTGDIVRRLTDAVDPDVVTSAKASLLGALRLGRR